MKIVVYGRKECVQCHWTKKLLVDELGLTFDYLDIDTDADAERDARVIGSELGTTQLPIVLVSNRSRTVKWAGFRPEKLRGIKSTGDY